MHHQVALKRRKNTIQQPYYINMGLYIPKYNFYKNAITVNVYWLTAKRNVHIFKILNSLLAFLKTKPKTLRMRLHLHIRSHIIFVVV